MLLMSYAIAHMRGARHMLRIHAVAALRHGAPRAATRRALLGICVVTPVARRAVTPYRRHYFISHAHFSPVVIADTRQLFAFFAPMLCLLPRARARDSRRDGAPLLLRYALLLPQRCYYRRQRMFVDKDVTVRASKMAARE